MNRILLTTIISLFLYSATSVAADFGDVDQDNEITTIDAIRSLQVVSGLLPDISQFTSGIDVNGDSKIGLAEVIYSLRFQTYSPPSCTAPVDLYDTSEPTAIIGDGSADSCTEEKLQNAADTGGTITFNCGSEPTTINISSPIVFKEATVVDGGGLITLDGGDNNRIFYLDSAYNLTEPYLVVQQLNFDSGYSPDGGDDTADGGGAIYRDGGSLTVIDCSFTNNHAATSGQDLAGGAIYGFGGGETIIVDSTFSGNIASNGGAVGSLNGDLTIMNSSFTDNQATGTGGNPGDGGCGGAVYMDGGDEATTLCGVTMSNNQAGAIGGAFFRVSNDSTGTFTMDTTTVDANKVTATDSGNAGGLYLQGLEMTVNNSTISRNQAYYNGGIWIHTSEVEMTNVTIADNTAFGSNGGGIWLSNDPTGTLLNCTIANNQSTGVDKIAGAIFGVGLSLKNTLIAYNDAMWVSNCSETHDDEGGNIQYPGGSTCTSVITITDPLLGDLGYHGGPTETMRPSSDSPAKNFASDCPNIDQRGQPRSTNCTAGAVEIQ